MREGVDDETGPPRENSREGAGQHGSLRINSRLREPFPPAPTRTSPRSRRGVPRGGRPDAYRVAISVPSTAQGHWHPPAKGKDSLLPSGKRSQATKKASLPGNIEPGAGHAALPDGFTLIILRDSDIAWPWPRDFSLPSRPPMGDEANVMLVLRPGIEVGAWIARTLFTRAP
ncbi:hypothetical protein VTK73DRAFT_5837 [Phialemonium thermophilum]|uniref:Uncharacterized protein n=1 Tax=Phialemonium thermophilum TaxID=223376 RepID=A0ABR3V0D3_9PEZI